VNGPVDLAPGEQAEVERMLAELRGHGYVDRDRHNKLAPGVRVRHTGHLWPQAYTEGTGTVVAIVEKPDSAWSASWGMPDVELIVVFDRGVKLTGRLSELAQYHVQAID
jgi:hypothetical protein